MNTSKHLTLVALIAGLAFGASTAMAESGKVTKEKPTVSATKAKAAKTTKAKKVAKAKPAKKEVTGYGTKQEVVVARFPSTTSPVEVWDRRTMERSGEGTLAGFLLRQSVFR